MMGTKSKKITSIQLKRFYKSKATNAFGYYDLRDISERCNIYINAFAAYDYQSTYIWLKVIDPCLVWILRQENAEQRLRQGLVQVSLRINNGMVRKQSLKETADFQLRLEKYISFTQLDFIHGPPQTTSQLTKYKMSHVLVT